ncbi:MAG: hypothetical protein ACTSP3_09335 [Candidatus Heimdallarchaeaceae archaeon]
MYDNTEHTVLAFDLLYNKDKNEWESSLIDLSDQDGKFFIRAKFSYAGRTVTSNESDTFTIEGTTTSPTTIGLTSPFLTSAMILTVILTIPILVRRVKRK